MDYLLVKLFNELHENIAEFRMKYPGLNIDSIVDKCLDIESHLDSSIEPIKYEEIQNYTRAPRVTPPGHLGPSAAMVKHALAVEKAEAQKSKAIIDRVKALTKQAPSYFPKVE